MDRMSTGVRVRVWRTTEELEAALAGGWSVVPGPPYFPNPMVPPGKSSREPRYLCEHFSFSPHYLLEREVERKPFDPTMLPAGRGFDWARGPRSVHEEREGDELHLVPFSQLNPERALAEVFLLARLGHEVQLEKKPSGTRRGQFYVRGHLPTFYVRVLDAYARGWELRDASEEDARALIDRAWQPGEDGAAALLHDFADANGMGTY